MKELFKYEDISNFPLSIDTKRYISDKYSQEKSLIENLDGITALYERLSRDDALDGDSNSIINQRIILEEYARKKGYRNIVHYDEDDGYTGTNFDRPGFQRLLKDIKSGKVSTLIVKDMSRLGRNYLQVGLYTDVVFPEYNVRFIAINDGFDSDEGESEFVAIKNIFNEFQGKDRELYYKQPTLWLYKESG